MFINKIQIHNFRKFVDISIDNIAIPTPQIKGSGLNVFLGNNGMGKTSILDAISFCIQDYRTDFFNIKDMNSTEKDVDICCSSNAAFEVKKTMPNSSFMANGFRFIGRIRKKKSSNYLNKLVSCDLQYVPVKDENVKPNSPDLRVKVDNPFSGRRYNGVEALYLDQNRDYQIKSGSFSSTRFDRMMEDLNFQYAKSSAASIDLNLNLKSEIFTKEVSSDSLTSTINKFKEITNLDVKLDIIDNKEPLKNASFNIKSNCDVQIPLAKIGSGFETIFAIIYSYYLSSKNGTDFILLIDEPELHLHPTIQKKFIDFILEISSSSQVFISTHSPLFIKQLFYAFDSIKCFVIKENGIDNVGDMKLSYISSNEINYLAFDVATEEYHNELYEELFHKYASSVNIKDFDFDYFINTKHEQKTSPWKGHQNEVSIHTFTRNQIHHRHDNGAVDYEQLKKSIITMRNYL